MATIVLHRLDDWPVARHLRPVLTMLGVPDAALDATLWYAAGAGSEIEPGERSRFPDADRALLAAGTALACLGRSVVGLPRTPAGDASAAGVTLRNGVVWKTLDEVSAALARDGHEVKTASVALHDPALRRDLDALPYFEDPARWGEMTVGDMMGTVICESRWFAAIAFYARFDELGRQRAEELLGAPMAQPYRLLVDLCLEHLFTKGRLDLVNPFASERACSDEAKPQFSRRLRQRLLFSDLERSVQDLLVLSYRYRSQVFSSEEDQALGSQWRRAVRKDCTLYNLALDESRFAFAPEEHRDLTVRAFRQALGGGLDASAYESSVAAVYEADPDLCLRALTQFVPGMPVRDVATSVARWHELTPTTGYSAEALAETAAFFSSPARRAHLGHLFAFLSARGVPVRAPEPLDLDDVDATEVVATDVGAVAIGCESALEILAETEDPADWARIVKKHRCAAFTTIGDGDYSVRVVSRTRAALDVASWRSIGVFPLEVRDEMLGISGIIGPDLPFVTFPSGTFAAELFVHESSVQFTLVVAHAKPPPKWPFGRKLPRAA